MPGWRQQGPSRAYGPDNLFDYKDGAAEGYLLYGFARLTGITCESGDDTIVIDISEMGSYELAYGMFAATRDPNGPAEKIGMGGQVLPQRASFSKDKYYVELVAVSERDRATALRAFATAIEKTIAGRSDPPEAIAWFPAEELVPRSVRLVPESVLGLRLLRRGYVAEYSFGAAFLVPEATPQAARELWNQLKARFHAATPANLAEESFFATDKYLGNMLVFRKGRYLAGFSHLKKGFDASPAATRLLKNLP